MEWISIKETVPQKNQKVRVKTNQNGKERIATYHPKDYTDAFMASIGFSWVFEDVVEGGDFAKITHWKALCEIPKK